MKTCSDAPVGYTDHPPVGEWQGWNGGVCPVHPLATVEYVMRAEQAGPDSAQRGARSSHRQPDHAGRDG